MSFRILTDSTADLQEEWALEHGVDLLGLTVQLDGKTYETVGPDRLTADVLLDAMKNGAKPQTSQINVGTFEKYFRKAAENQEDVLYIAFSSTLSGTYQSAVMAREVVLEDFPDATIDIIDTLAAAGGEGLLAILAVRAREEGKSLTETRDFVRDIMPRLHTFFLVDDLYHLMRGGRVSKASAVMGSLANIKPVLWIDPEGRLIPTHKVRGRKKGMKKILELGMQDIALPTAVVAHASDPEGAAFLAQQLLEDEAISEVITLPLGPVISSHVGPNTLAVFVIGEKAR